MGYSKEIYQEAAGILEQRRNEAAAQAEALLKRATARDPRVEEIRRALSGNVLKVTRAVLSGMEGKPADLPAALEAARQESLALQRELADRLHAMGETADDFDPRPVCPRCHDTGYVGGAMCQCFTRLLQETACRQLSALSHMTLTRFEDMDLSYYSDKPEGNGPSPRQRMADVVAFCRTWAEDFSPDSPSLLLRGPAGTGKTHLSLAMAREVVSRGFRVVYGSVGRLLRQLEKEHFGRETGDSAEELEGCDLLILDDLGTEFASPFYTSALYELINGRILAEKPTIISTNLSLKQMQDRYGTQIASRIAGCFQPLLFAGEDVRQQKLLRRLQQED